MARLRVLQQALHFRQNPFRIQSLTKQYLTSSSNQASLYIGVTSTRNLSTSSKLLKYNLPEIPPEDEPFIVKSPYSDVEIPETNLADYVWKDVDKWPERTALVSLNFIDNLVKNLSNRFHFKDEMCDLTMFY